MAQPPTFPMRLPLYARTPPAVFPLCLGFVGLSLIWRKAAVVFGFPTGVGDVLIGLAASLFAVALLLYLRKLAARPVALLDDLRSPAGRGAMSASTMTLMLLGFGLAPASMELARALWLGGLVLHFILAGLLIDILMKLQRGARPATPALYVPFVGQIVAPIGGVQLGYEAVSAGLFVFALLVWIGLTGPIAVKLAKGWPQPPVRPPLAILLSPPAVGVIAHEALPPEYQAAHLSVILFALSSVIAVALLVRASWLTEGGFTPLWAGFTFPFAAYAGAALALADRRLGGGWDVLAAGALAAATLVIVYVGYRFAKAAKAGELFRAPVI